MLFLNSVIVKLDAPTGILVTWTYPFWSGFFANTPDIGRQTEFPHRTFPPFMNPDPEITPFLRTAWKTRKKERRNWDKYIKKRWISRVISYANHPWGWKIKWKQLKKRLKRIWLFVDIIERSIKCLYYTFQRFLVFYLNFLWKTKKITWKEFKTCYFINSLAENKHSFEWENFKVEDVFVSNDIACMLSKRKTVSTTLFSNIWNVCIVLSAFVSTETTYRFWC